jgi:hypothetical protein
VFENAAEIVDHAQPAHVHVAPANEDRQGQKQAEQNEEDDLRLPEVEKSRPIIHDRASAFFAALQLASLGQVHCPARGSITGCAARSCRSSEETAVAALLRAGQPI